MLQSATCDVLIEMHNSTCQIEILPIQRELPLARESSLLHQIPARLCLPVLSRCLINCSVLVQNLVLQISFLTVRKSLTLSLFALCLN